MPSRAFVVGAGIGATVLAAAGITYASPVESTPASPTLHRATQPLHHSAQSAHHATLPVQLTAFAASASSATAPSGVKTGDGGGNQGRDGDGGRDDGGRRGDGGRHDDGGRRGDGGRHDGGGRYDGGRHGDDGRYGYGFGGRGRGHGRVGRIFVNERSYPAFAEGCITVASGLGAHSFNVLNESWKTVEVFRGFNCDGGPPVATVGPRSESFGVVPHGHDGDGEFGSHGDGGFGHRGVVGSFRVVCGHGGWW
ncbi:MULTISPECIES: hypothetical protein [unclassified Streptomyces]|uniref:hypothetical protein n=1 Tax=unclassified Streptomyces TaxID=2593676 RepID=UPI00404237D7